MAGRRQAGRQGVYPRVCGGSIHERIVKFGKQGLSPRVRGKRAQPSRNGECHRSIPACAGEAGAKPPGRVVVGVYPRVCGGSKTARKLSQAATGLSPRVRGKLVVYRWQGAPSRSIPACAGEALAAVLPSLSPLVYPRVCGGSPSSPPKKTLLPGLSPRVRGKLDGDIAGGGRGGSIPACAGEAEYQHRQFLLYAVYPRVCGGSRRGTELAAGADGLSPRVRGKPTHMGGGVPASGSIPACAGEANSALAIASIPAVYPRVCGGSVA